MCLFGEGSFFKKVEPIKEKKEPERMWEEAQGNPLHRNKFSAAIALASPRSLSQWMHIEDKPQPAVVRIGNVPK